MNGIITPIDSIKHPSEFIHHTQLPQYKRTSVETINQHAKDSTVNFIPHEDVLEFIKSSSISKGSQDLLIGFIKLATLQQFPGGYGFNYDALYKKAVRPEYTSAHIAEVGEYLKKAEVDFIMVPGLSGYAIGAEYADRGGKPALLLTKEEPEEAGTFPVGSFCIPSYTGTKNVVIHPNIAAARGIFSDLCTKQLDLQKNASEIIIRLRGAAADDIQDHGTMFKALGESARLLAEAEVAWFIKNYQKKSGDKRNVGLEFAMAAFITPLKKSYNHGDMILKEVFGLTSNAGIEIDAIYPDSNVISVKGVGNIQMRTS